MINYFLCVALVLATSVQAMNGQKAPEFSDFPKELRQEVLKALSYAKGDNPLRPGQLAGVNKEFATEMATLFTKNPEEILKVVESSMDRDYQKQMQGYKEYAELVKLIESWVKQSDSTKKEQEREKIMEAEDKYLSSYGTYIRRKPERQSVKQFVTTVNNPQLTQWYNNSVWEGISQGMISDDQIRIVIPKKDPTVADLVKATAKARGLHEDEIRLIFANKQLNLDSQNNQKTLRSFGIPSSPDTRIYLVRRLRPVNSTISD